MFNVSSENLWVGMGVSLPLGGSEVTLILDMASQKPVWLAVVEGALIMKIISNLLPALDRVGLVKYKLA